MEGVEDEFLEKATKRYHEDGPQLERESSDDEDEGDDKEAKVITT